ncbi:Invasion protein expression up-regulator SirB [Candidatus Methylobacter favarea]|uniref:Invasion protein expression up-regulator SirB n=1 Tax=Candidatus Methylobacter favarea TaxID=2707345 RepID=A0A8S0WLG2_9GAMM|nr:SirB2 family protein [Candidatus Methylobacter favarea]CAA9892600.1 Invasion protein expression up-regulator SirB [Candidatus Methylobacter favarea]
MIKTFHLGFVLISIFSFTGRIILAEIQPELLKQKALKITPHVIDTLLLASGFMLAIQGHWFSGEYGWIIGKLFGLAAYIGFGVAAMHNQGAVRWLAFAAAIACFAYIGMVAVTKNALFFL